MLTLAPGAMVPLCDAFVAVTMSPNCVMVVFQSERIVCPIGSGKVRDHPSTGSVPELVMVRSTVMPPPHAFVVASIRQVGSVRSNETRCRPPGRSFTT